MGQDRKYGRVTTEHGDIPDDEPVIVFRARDLMAVPALAAYYAACQDAGSPQRHLDIVEGTRAHFEKWQRDHPDRVRVPDSGSSRDRI